MIPLPPLRSRQPFHLRPRRWLALPLVTFAIGAVMAVGAGAGASQPAGFSAGTTLVIEREVAAARARVAARRCDADDERTDPRVRWGEPAELVQARASEARVPAIASAAELRRIERGLAAPACPPTAFALIIGAVDVEDAIRSLADTVRASPPAGAERAALIAALDRPPPPIDIAAMNDAERDFVLTWNEPRLAQRLLREEALLAGHHTLRQHAQIRATCTAAMPAAACARALEHDDHVNASFPYAIRTVLDAHAMLGELRDELIAAR